MPPAKGPPVQHSQLSAPTSSSSQMNGGGGRIGPPSGHMPPPSMSAVHHFSGPSEKSQSYMSQPPASNGRQPTFAQPFKLDGPPLHQPNKQLPPPPTIQKPSLGGGNIGGSMMPPSVDSILKMMTSTVDPLGQIAPTPRTDVVEQHPTRPLKYMAMSLPPLFRKPGKRSPLVLLETIT